ncbi:MAG: pyruvate kinase, partial [Candidatus Thermoplasmatota archaeon]|nr:pyruvate kinase [Candidatus Thermoplasmatota archaeon]
MRQTKIVCTIGPSSSNAKTLRRMMRAGMDAARLNFSHGTHEDHARAFHLIMVVAQEMGLPIAIIQDLQGPKIRAGKFQDGSVRIEPDSRVTITTDKVLGT